MVYLTTLVITIAIWQSFVVCDNNNNTVHVKDGQKPGRIANLDADIIIGGLFPVHLIEKNASKCSQDVSKYIKMAEVTGKPQCYRLNSYAMMWIEAMMFAIKQINSRSDLLPGVTLGYDIRDSFNDVNYAIKCSLDFILPVNSSLTNKTSRNSSTSRPRCFCGNERKKSVVAVVGGAGSKISKAVNYIFAVDDIPQISYSSTSPSLSDKNNFPSFLRTIPPDYVQAQVMADLISRYEWSYVSTVATDEDYGRLGIEAFKVEVKSRNVCISVEELFHPDIRQPRTKAKIKHIVKKLKDDKKANVVVLFCEEPNALAVLEEAERQDLKDKIWIGTEAWGDKSSVLHFKSFNVGGMLGVVPWKGNIEPFQKHMAGLNPDHTHHNPWFREYWEGVFGCKKSLTKQNSTINSTQCANRTCSEPKMSNGSTWKCPGYESPYLPTASKIQLNKAPNVMDSVYAISWGLHAMLNCTSGVAGSCSRSKVVPWDLLAYIKSSNFTGVLGYPIKFDKHGDTKGNYLIKSLQPSNSSQHGKHFVTIGYWRWFDRKLVIHKDNIVWNSWSQARPTSRCSVPCTIGEYPVNGGTPCCWTCVKCPTGYIKNTTGVGTCRPCMLGYTTDNTHSKCLDLPMLYLRWSELTAIVILSFSAIGLAMTAFVLCVFLRYSQTAVVKASTREFTFLMLVIIALMFALTTMYIGRPTYIICQVRPFFFAFVIACWTSLMLTKTNRLLMIFKSKGIPAGSGILGIRVQLVLAVFLTVLIIGISIAWVTVFPPKVTMHYRDTHVIFDCGNQSDKLLIITLGYTAVLAITTTFLAYKARNLPENFNETRCIGFSMFTFCVIWLTYIPLYYGTDPETKYLFLCSCLIVTGFSSLFCMFFNRLWIILFHPEQNRTEVIRASMFVYTMRDRNGSLNNAVRNMRRTSVVTVGNFTLPTQS